jgi:N-acetylmuramoyl-L-alanine amidase
VTTLQKLLRGVHLTNVVNGTYGVWTRRAVRKFQHKHGLRADGIVGPATWKALRKAQG